MRRRLARGALLVVLSSSAVAYGALEKSITVKIEGTPVTVRTFAMTVGDLLERRGVEVGVHDWVNPSLKTPVVEGTSIEIRRAKQVNVLLNGKPRKIITTALTIDQMLAEMRVAKRIGDFVGVSRASRVDPGMTVVYRQAVALKVRHDGEVADVITNAPDVATVIKELGLSVGKRDIVEPGGPAYPKAKMTIVIKRVGDHEERISTAIPFPTTYRRTVNMEYGTRRTITEGRAGVKVTSYLSTFVDGVRVKQKFIASSVESQPRPEIVAIGAGFPGCVCKSGTQFGKASWYDAPGGGLTAAHPYLPFGTVVRVDNLANGSYVNVVIRDRGPYSPGRIIDLSRAAFDRIASLGTGVIEVKIRW